MRKDGYKIDAVKYEDLVKYPLESTRSIFAYSGLPVEWAEDAITALSKDSQRHSPLSRKNLSNAKNLELEGNDKVMSDAVCDQMGLTRVPEPCNLEGTITAQFKCTEGEEAKDWTALQL